MVHLDGYLIHFLKNDQFRYQQDLNIVDITHTIPPFNYPQAAYICRNTINNFPPGTFHLILVNIFDEKSNLFILVEHKGHFIGCADNGLITMILEEEPQKYVALELNQLMQKSTLTFTNLFAKAIYELSKGKTIEEIGNSSIEIKSKKPLKPTSGDDWIEGQIIFIDNFENVIINISKIDFETTRKGRNFSIVFKRDEVIEKISAAYSDVNEGDKLALFNSAGYLEIAVNKGNAAGLFGLQGYGENQYLSNRLFYQTVKVFFH
jgi:S-adenosylmethionine hydrolase